MAALHVIQEYVTVKGVMNEIGLWLTQSMSWLGPPDQFSSNGW